MNSACFKTINLVRDALSRMQGPSSVPRIAPLTALMTTFTTTAKKMAKAREHGFTNAAQRQKRSIESLLGALENELVYARRCVTPQPPPVPSYATLMDDLDQIEEEFGEWMLNRTSKCLAVHTDDIELEGVYLGPFEIQLKLAELECCDPRTSFKILALDPRPAGTDSAVTHPHVSGGRLCCGEAVNAINEALRQGRLCDFFLIVRSVLTTYNPDSPYVSLDEWHGIPCYECGEHMSEDDRCYCESCGYDYCECCASYCRGCEESRCNSCLTSCAGCDVWFCSSCLTTCEECDAKCCSGCLEDGLCAQCAEEKERQEEEASNEEEELALCV